MDKLKRKKLYNNLIIISIFMISFTFSISSYITVSDNLISTSFLVNYLGVFLGIVITLITYIHSAINSIKENSAGKDDIYNELKENTLMIFVFFIISIFIMGIEKINFPIISLGKYYKLKVLIIDYIRNLFLFFSLYAMYDIIVCLFILIFSKQDNT